MVADKNDLSRWLISACYLLIFIAFTQHFLQTVPVDLCACLWYASASFSFTLQLKVWTTDLINALSFQGGVE